MPKATRVRHSQRFELSTAPPDGYIVIQQLTYGEILTRRELGLRWMADDAGESSLATMQRAIVGFDFARCIVEHNLLDEYERPLNFTDPEVFEIIDPRVASEIEQLLDGLHEFNPQTVEDGFLGQSTSSQTPPETDSPEPKPKEKSARVKS